MNSQEPQPNTQPADASDESGTDERQATNLEPNQMARFISEIKNPTLQVGEHVLAALQHPNTMAVLTTVVTGPSRSTVTFMNSLSCAFSDDGARYL